MSTTGDILLVEDEAFIAIETQMSLEEAEQDPIVTCSDAEEAFAYLSEKVPRAVLLDYNLGKGRTSQGLAEALLERGIPFAFLTGYSEATMRLPEPLLDAPRFSKPCHVGEVVGWLESL